MQAADRPDGSRRALSADRVHAVNRDLRQGECPASASDLSLEPQKDRVPRSFRLLAVESQVVIEGELGDFPRAKPLDDLLGSASPHPARRKRRESFGSVGGWSTATATLGASPASPPAPVTLAGRATEQEFEVTADGAVVSDRDFSWVEVEVCEHRYVEGEGCPVCDSDGESFESHGSYSDSF